MSYNLLVMEDKKCSDVIIGAFFILLVDDRFIRRCRPLLLDRRRYR